MHTELERRLSEFLGTEDTILYSSRFDANGGFFEPLFGPEDAIIADALNHASIIDGVRLTKAKRFIYAHSDMDDLRAKLEEARGARYRVIATDGVFSMDGDIADLRGDLRPGRALRRAGHGRRLARHRVRGRHRPRHAGALRRRGTAWTSSRRRSARRWAARRAAASAAAREIVEWLRQKSRPYLFSNTLAPVVAATTIAVLDLLIRDDGAARPAWSATRASSVRA